MPESNAFGPQRGIESKQILHFLINIVNISSKHGRFTSRTFWAIDNIDRRRYILRSVMRTFVRIFGQDVVVLPGFSYHAAIARLHGAFAGQLTYESLDDATLALAALGSRLTSEIEIAFMAAVRDSESHAA